VTDLVRDGRVGVCRPDRLAGYDSQAARGSGIVWCARASVPVSSLVEPTSLAC
jgi:hypothetical protein